MGFWDRVLNEHNRQTNHFNEIENNRLNHINGQNEVLLKDQTDLIAQKDRHIAWLTSQLNTANQSSSYGLYDVDIENYQKEGKKIGKEELEKEYTELFQKPYEKNQKEIEKTPFGQLFKELSSKILQEKTEKLSDKELALTFAQLLGKTEEEIQLLLTESKEKVMNGESEFNKENNELIKCENLEKELNEKKIKMQREFGSKLGEFVVKKTQMGNNNLLETEEWLIYEKEYNEEEKIRSQIINEIFNKLKELEEKIKFLKMSPEEREQEKQRQILIAEQREKFRIDVSKYNKFVS